MPREYAEHSSSNGFTYNVHSYSSSSSFAYSLFTSAQSRWQINPNWMSQCRGTIDMHSVSAI